MNLHETKVYKKGLYDVLFSKQNKFKRKINITIFILFSIISLYSFAVISFIDKDVKTMAWVLASQGFSIIFASIGYIWLNKSGINYKQELIWFYISLGISFAIAFSHWIFMNVNDGDFKNLIYFPILICFFVFIHSLHLAIKKGIRKPVNAALPASTFSFLLAIMIGTLLLKQVVTSLKTPITFIAIFFLLAVGLRIFAFIMRGRKAKVILENGSSVRVLITALLVGPIFAGIKEMIVDFEFDASSMGFIGGQIIAGALIIWLLVKSKNEFKTSFIKGYVLIVGIFMQAGLMLAAREIQTIYSSGGYQYVGNLIVGMLLVMIMSLINIRFNVARKPSFMFADSAILFIFLGSISALIIFYVLDVDGAFNNDLAVDELMLYLPFAATIVNMAMSTFSWWKIMSNKKRERVWN